MVRRGALFLALGIVALIAQGALAMVLSPPWCPDLVLLVLIGIGLRWEGAASGIFLAGVLGYATDLLSGSLLGQHALLDLFAFGGTLLATRQFNLHGAFPLACFAVAMSMLYAAGMLAIAGLFVGESEVGYPWLRSQLIHATVAGVAAPLASWLIGVSLDRFGDPEASHRAVRVGGAG